MQINTLQMLLDLDDKSFKKMEGSFIDDKEFKSQIKELEEKFGPLVSNELRDRFHLEKDLVYGRRINQDLEEMVKNMRNLRDLSVETNEIFVNDFDKLKAAFEMVRFDLTVKNKEVNQNVIVMNQNIEEMSSHDSKKRLFLGSIIVLLGLIDLIIMYLKFR